jgi:XTP/dITP diphosphohydrolase
LKTYVASKNEGKLRELRELFAGSPLELDTYPGYHDVAEDATSYIGNAMLKARALQAQLRDDGIEAAVLSDDSGLEVDVLGGRPGVLSARYAGRDSTWTQRLGLMLGEMQGVPEDHRAARFACVMVLLVPDNEPCVGLGIVEGRMTERAIGDAGFGYDPIFFYPPYDCTFGEVSAERKNAVSHRRRAADALLASLRTRV